MGGGTPIGQAPGSLIGRADDLEYITAFVDRAAVSGGALLLSGEAGVGFSALALAPYQLTSAHTVWPPARTS
jgi:hypothetical protein